ncbi:response regulator transcription factor [Candidatus Pristimantibacillus sp. PTI5]|uniref:response regulator transcription factor n=1 Tax=Candidatus Pristimantibacillus sp. PTI5 TaxID=3400422 RepID=UPI003B02CB06
MHEVLIVDDERSVVEGVAATLPCDELKIGTVHKAFSATDALAIMRQHPVDLVITDIRMPGISGLELMDKVQEASPSTQCILLTGHAEFEYAKRAITGGASDYLLKPVNDEDLIQAVDKALGTVRREWEELVSRDNTMKTMRENLPLLRRDLLIELLQGHSIPADALADKLSQLMIPFSPNDAVALLLIRLEEPFVHYGYKDRTLLEYAVSNVAEEVLRESCQVWACKEAHGYLAFAVKRTNQSKSREWTKSAVNEQLMRLGELIQRQVETYLKGAVSVVIGEEGAFPEHLAASYGSALAAFRKHIGRGKGYLLSLGEHQEKAAVQTLRRLYEPPMLQDLLEAGRWDAFEEKLGLIFEELETEFGDSAEHAFESFCAVTGALTFIAHKSGYGLFEFLKPSERASLNFESFETFGQLRDGLFRLAALMRLSLEREAADGHTKLIYKVQRFIEEHLDRPISLQMIADRVHLHPVYVSQMYKTVTGESLTDYMLRIRMEKSAYLLKTTNLKIYEIGMKFSYQNAAYFIKQFKKVYGMTPQEYKDQHSI